MTEPKLSERITRNAAFQSQWLISEKDRKEVELLEVENQKLKEQLQETEHYRRIVEAEQSKWVEERNTNTRIIDAYRKDVESLKKQLKKEEDTGLRAVTHIQRELDTDKLELKTLKEQNKDLDIRRQENLKSQQFWMDSCQQWEKKAEKAEAELKTLRDECNTCQMHNPTLQVRKQRLTIANLEAEVKTLAKENIRLKDEMVCDNHFLKGVMKERQTAEDRLAKAQSNILDASFVLANKDGCSWASTMTSLEDAVMLYCKAIGLNFKKKGVFMDKGELLDELNRLKKALGGE